MQELWHQIVIILIILSRLIGSVSALRQENIKRLFAYGTISNIGYVLIGIISNSAQGLSASILYLVIYTVASLGVFSFIMMLRKENSQILNLNGIAGFSQVNPVASVCMVMLLLSMAGIRHLLGSLRNFIFYRL